ncbi:MAG TPA: hypothetical protein VLT59_01075, partial [Steroidobacteraceae bacterium]|nr:hypothetical protein [Steroidobacteraceae bacterium]
MPRDSTPVRLQKAAVLLIVLLPALSLLARTFELGGSSLGANPVEELLHGFGKWGLNLLMITLMVSPAREILNAPWLLRFRRLLGVTAFFYVAMHFLIWLGLDQGFYFP